MPIVPNVLKSPLLPVAMVVLIVGLDWVQDSRRWDVLETGVLDEPAHLATAALALSAVVGWPLLCRYRSFTVAALIASMAIDIDHIPLYAGVRHISAFHGGRPFTHSLATVVVLLLLSGLVRRARPVLLGAGIGVALHLFRDLATGPGVSLFWPLSWSDEGFPHSVYIGILCLLAAAATLRAALANRQSNLVTARAGQMPE